MSTAAARADMPCRICGSAAMTVVYTGPVRRGVFGEFLDARVQECEGCGTARLTGAGSLENEAYRTEAYRQLVGEKTDASSFFQLHDDEQFDKLGLVRGLLRRGAVVADVGCAAGSFLDFVKGLAGATLAIEPAESYHTSLRERGHTPFPETGAAVAAWAGRVDLVTCFSVIEHVEDPVALLSEMGRLLGPEGRLLISTPNRRDLLVAHGPDAYRSFFYRQVHRFYFDADSLASALARAGLFGERVHYHQRFGFANFANWLRQARPSGPHPPHVLDDEFDAVWRRELEKRGVADYLYLVARHDRASNAGDTPR